ncbi:MAG: PQQ-dependent sugar dehydrogenase [Candidatus Bathyarchaeia archaeon]
MLSKPAVVVAVIAAILILSQWYTLQPPTETSTPTQSPLGEFHVRTNKPVYLPGEAVEIEVENIGPTVLEFPNSALGLRILSVPSRQPVYDFLALQVVTTLQPGERKVFTWTQTDAEGQQILLGNYVAEAGTIGGKLVAEAAFAITMSREAEVNLDDETSTPGRLTFKKVYGDLNFPVSLAFAPDGRIFFNERTTGQIRIIRDGVLLPTPFAIVKVENVGETGLLGLALHPDFENQPHVYIYYTQRDENGHLRNRVARFTAEGNRGIDFTVLLDDIPAASVHNGGVLAFGPDGNLYITTGDASRRNLAQDAASLAGKVLRITPRGTIPEDNPFPGSPVFSMGHRNIFGLTFHPSTGKPYITENGPATDDEINILESGRNYGWPQTLGTTGDSDFIQPILTLTPVVAPTGVAFHEGDKLPQDYRHNLFFGDWITGSIHRVVLASPTFDRVESVEVVAKSDAGGILDLESGPDGYLYATTPTGIYRLEYGS